ncbi:MAG: hypothetical protein LBF42_03820, partial [Puniceicoccales bacterium]|nr:hypothetical protein [Puniceicoccales bacterium]
MSGESHRIHVHVQGTGAESLPTDPGIASVEGNRSAFSTQQKTQIQNLHNRFVEKREIRSLTAQARRDILALNEELEKAFSSKEALNTFARNTLGLRDDEFDANQFSETDLQTLKNMVMGELAEARAKKYGW